jgi:hypothetical protein
MSARQLPGQTEQVVRGDARELGKPRGEEQGRQQHDPEHAIGIGSRTRNLKR